MSDWRPIETAPKDDTACLVWNGTNVSVARFGEVRQSGKVEWWPLANGETVDDNTHYHEMMVVEPSHWMPLPEPPTTTSCAPPEPKA